MGKLRFAMRCNQIIKAGFSILSILSLRLLIAAACFSPLLIQADEVSFEETYTEKLLVEDGFGEVIWSGDTTFEILLPWNGAVNIDEITGDTVIALSIGSEFQFNQILDSAENYEVGERSARFREVDTDNNGNPVTALFIDVTWNTKTFSISGILHNFSSASEVNFFGARDHLGMAGPFQDTISADITFGGLNVMHNLAVAGKNTITSKTTPEDEDPFLLNNVQLSGSADLPPNDTTKPTVSITSPAANGKIFTPRITGKAGDAGGIAEVFYRIGAGDFMLAEGTNNWFADVTLEPGTNTVEVKSVDLAGNESTVLSRTFFYALLSPLTVEIGNGEGATTLTNGQLLELGKNYSITATPAPSYLFQEWLGNTINSSNATLNFTMETNLFLQANFIPNPFIPAKGIYNGLFSNVVAEVHPATAGYLTLTLKDSGAFSGRVFLDGARHPISGSFDLTGRADETVFRRGKRALTLILQLEMDGKLTGTIMQGGAVTSALEGELAQSTTNSSKTNYTLLIPPGSDPATEPGGYGSGSVTIDLKGKLRFKGVLGDGTAASQTTAVSKSGRWPLFVSLYRGKGVLLGWVTFTNEPANDVRGDLTWAKIPGAAGKFYTNGFTIFGPLIGSQYMTPPRGTPVLNWTNGSIELSGGNLAAPLTNEITVATNNKVTVTSTNRTTLSITAASGLLRGSFINPGTGRSSSIKGALLQKQQWGGGVFLGTNQTGLLMVQPDL